MGEACRVGYLESVAGYEDTAPIWAVPLLWYRPPGPLLERTSPVGLGLVILRGRHV